MALIKGIKIVLISKVQVGVDDFNRPVHEEVEEEVDNVLVMPASADDIVTSIIYFRWLGKY